MITSNVINIQAKFTTFWVTLWNVFSSKKVNGSVSYLIKEVNSDVSHIQRKLIAVWVTLEES